MAALANSPDGVRSKFQFLINVGPHSGSKHHTGQLLPLPSRYLMIAGPKAGLLRLARPGDLAAGGGLFVDGGRAKPPNSVAMTGYFSAAKPKSSSHFGSHGCGRLFA